MNVLAIVQGKLCKSSEQVHSRLHRTISMSVGPILSHVGLHAACQLPRTVYGTVTIAHAWTELSRAAEHQ